MDARLPQVRIVRRRCAPKTFPCPHCSQRGRRKDTHTRRVRDIAYGAIVVVELTTGEYRARCSCCKTFRSQIDGIEPPESLGEAGPHFVDVAQGKPRRRGARRIDPAAGKGDNAGGMVTVGHGRPQDRVYVTLDRSLCRACRCGQQIARHGGGTMLGADEVAIA